MSCKIQFLVYAGLVLGVPSRSSKRQYGVQASTLPTADDVAHISALEVKREGWLYGQFLFYFILVMTSVLTFSKGMVVVRKETPLQPP